MARHARGEGRHRARRPVRFRPQSGSVWVLLCTVAAVSWALGASLGSPSTPPSAPLAAPPTASPPVSRNVPSEPPITAVVPVRYENCAEAPGRLTRMMAGYATWLDPDGDGVACEGK